MIAATRFPWLSSESVFPLASLACFFPEQPKPKFSADDPAKLIARTEQPVFRPEMPFEQSGQYAAGTTFAEGLVVFKGRWWMYYGCADSFVRVAAAPMR
jgi:hypothetical protein